MQIVWHLAKAGNIMLVGVLCHAVTFAAKIVLQIVVVVVHMDIVNSTNLSA